MPNPNPIPDLPLLDRTALAGEILGAPVRFAASSALAQAVEGVVVDESMSMWTVRVAGRVRPVRIPKRGTEGTILLGGRELPLRGETLRVRPEDRTKRLLAGGPRRFR
ncbi:MAG: ribonuclease P protein subunit [Thermoplasmata archaeon]|jgi:RNase P/RNase MRP subunit p29|nr:ribonuclease P protein subunit [Thermoplasmata archaeon]